MAVIIPMPPVRYTATAWTVSNPVSESKSALTGYTSTETRGPARRMASITISAWGNDYTGAGYAENLIILLNGGVNFIRLYSSPIQWFPRIATDRLERAGDELRWGNSEFSRIDWGQGFSEMTWLEGVYLTGVVGTKDGLATITVSGLRPNQLVARPSEFIEIENGGVTETHRVFTETYSDNNGDAVIKLMTTPTTGGRVSLGASESAVFRVSGSMPIVNHTAGADYSYTFNLEEVLPNERIGATEYESDYWNA